MEKYDEKKFGKHFINYGLTPIAKHHVALLACFFLAVITLVIFISTTPHLAGIPALLALASYYFYGKWKKEMGADLGAKLDI